MSNKILIIGAPKVHPILFEAGIGENLESDEYMH